MNINFKLPELGENVHSGDVVSVLVKEGNVITKTRASSSWKPIRPSSRFPARTPASWRSCW